MDGVKVDLPLNPEDVAEIIAILENSGYEKLELRTARFALRVARSGASWTQQWDWNPSASGSIVDTAQPNKVSHAIDRRTPAAESSANDGLEAILPPLPGTFYRSPQPGAPPFVEEGSMVTQNTVVGIVETMKLMNPVHAGVRGKVVTILVPNGTLIDAQTVLMRVAPDSK